MHCQEVLILVDSGSSASFVGSHLLGLIPGVEKLQQTVKVQVADGGQLQCQYVIPDCEWLCQGKTFAVDLKVLPLSGYDIVLGMDWLEQYSPMTVHWARKWMKFEYKGQEVTLQGVQPLTEKCQMISGEQLESLIRLEAVEQVLELSVDQQDNKSEITIEAIQQLVKEFQTIFEETNWAATKASFQSCYTTDTGSSAL